MTDISREIRQQTFDSVHHKAMVNLLFTNNRIMEKLNNFFKDHGLTNQQFNVLRILRGRHPEPCNARYIREVMIFKAPDLTRLIDRLVIKGLADRKTCPDNRREIEVTITDKGLALLEELNPQVKQLTNEMLQLTEQEAEMLSALLDKSRGD